MTDNIYKPEFVKGLFNRMSNSYERMNIITSFGFSVRWRRKFLDPIQPTTEKIEIIDLLTGMGETWKSVKHKFPNANISALDFSTEMLKQAKRNNSQYYDNKISLFQQDILNNKLPSNHYDIVICAFGLKTFDQDQLRILAKETKRILKPNGQFSFIEISKPQNKILKKFYGFYLGQIIPILGKILLGNPTEYKMLWNYTDKYENSKGAMNIFKNLGLVVNYNSYFYDCSTGFNGHKE